MTAEAAYAVDTSVAVPLVVASHEQHAVVEAWASGRTLRLSGHALVETYSVLTRLPGDARVALPDAVRVIDENFGEALVLSIEALASAHRLFSAAGIAGGAVYDGLVGLTAREHDAVLVTRDARAKSTYEALGVRVHVLSELRGPGL